MRTITRDIVGAFVFSSDGKTLLGLHGPKSSYAGYWVVVGGGIDKGETKEQALRREFLEEANLDLAPYEVRFVDDIDIDSREKTLNTTGERIVAATHFHNFEVHIDRPADQIAVTPNEEFERLEWIALSDLPNLHVAPITYGGFQRLGYIK